MYNLNHHHAEQTPKTREIGEYTLAQTIGRGSSGCVKLGFHRHTGEKVAVKVIPRAKLKESTKVARAVERELAVLQLLHHPHLIELKQVLQDTTYIYFVMEFVEGGELFQALQCGRLSLNDATMLFKQLASAIAWCHSHHICHRDLKPENILLDKTRHLLKVADFGMAAMQPSGSLLRTSCGSPHYASPEVIKGKSYYGPAADVWSCGVILYALLTGWLPFDDNNLSRLLYKIKNGRQRALPDYVPASVQDLLQRMLTVDPVKRISMNEVLSHPCMILGGPFSHVNYSTRHHFEQLCGPMIRHAADIDGPIWETLKVLWRGLGHQDKILSALTAHSPNAQKLTFRLLQQRTSRLKHGPASCRHDDTNDEVCSSSPSSIYRVVGPCADCISKTPFLLYELSSMWRRRPLALDTPASCLSVTNENECWSPENKTTPADVFLSLSQGVYHASCGRSRAITRLRRLQETRSCPRSKRWTASEWIFHTWKRFFTNKVFAISCTTHHEDGAAGKLHQDLEIDASYSVMEKSQRRYTAVCPWNV